MLILLKLVRQGQGNEFHEWLPDGTYVWRIWRACGGDRQDGVTEGAMTILMNLPIFLVFLRWCYECGHCDGILEKIGQQF